METTKWKHRSDIKVFKAETLEQLQKVCNDVYLAEPFTINQSKIDSETGEVKQWKDIILEAGTRVTSEIIQKIQFTQMTENAEDLSEIFFSFNYYPAMEEKMYGLRAFEIMMKIGNSIDDRPDSKVLVFAGTAAKALQIATEYIAIYTDEGRESFIFHSMVAKDYMVWEDIEETKDDCKISDRRYYQVFVDIAYTIKGMGSDPEHPIRSSIKFICDAEEVADARETAESVIRKEYEQNYLVCDIKIVKAQPYAADYIVPYDYSRSFYTIVKLDGKD